MSHPDDGADQFDALVVFGATGDLAHKQTFPALHALPKRGERSGDRRCLLELEPGASAGAGP